MLHTLTSFFMFSLLTLVTMSCICFHFIVLLTHWIKHGFSVCVLKLLWGVFFFRVQLDVQVGASVNNVF